MVHVAIFEVFNFCVENVISDVRRQVALVMLESIHKKIMRTPFDKTSYLEQKARKVFHPILETNAVDLAPLQEFLGDYFRKVKSYNKL